MKTHFSLINLWCIPFVALASSNSAVKGAPPQTLEHHLIDNSDLNDTCVDNPCKNGARCFYTKASNQFFCKCKACSSGRFCEKLECNEMPGHKDSAESKNSYHIVDNYDYIQFGIDVFLLVALIGVLAYNIYFYHKSYSGIFRLKFSNHQKKYRENCVASNIYGHLNGEERQRRLKMERDLTNSSFLEENICFELKGKRSMAWDDSQMKRDGIV
uniref:EGF-like domain-containing protein n=1 Tax=Rhabditophanes sp. KR3021 TaxID=114890 RepID=A0AC35TQA2_9BILA